jgi:hypothetical protein
MALLTSASRAPRVFKHAIKTMGYGLWTKRGLGGTVTQATSRSTGVTFDTSTNRGKLCGAITTNAASLAAAAQVTFTVTNKAVGANDVIILSIKSGSTTPGSTWATVTAVAEGSFNISLANLTAATADVAALVINFMVIKSVVN